MGFKKILDFGKVPNAVQVAAICNDLPILAAFAVFLYQRQPALFELQFGQLADVKDFRDWITKRLKISMSELNNAEGDHIIGRQLALLMLRLPIPIREVEDLADLSRDKPEIV